MIIQNRFYLAKKEGKGIFFIFAIILLILIIDFLIIQFIFSFFLFKINIILICFDLSLLFGSIISGGSHQFTSKIEIVNNKLKIYFPKKIKTYKLTSPIIIKYYEFPTLLKAYILINNKIKISQFYITNHLIIQKKCIKNKIKFISNIMEED